MNLLGKIGTALMVVGIIMGSLILACWVVDHIKVPPPVGCLDEVAIVFSDVPHRCSDPRQRMLVSPMPGAVMHLQMLCTCARPPAAPPDAGAK